MVDSWSGRWIPEDDYSNYPEEKMCDMDRLYIGLKKEYPDYKPTLCWEELLQRIFDMFEEDWEEDGYENDSVENCLYYAISNSMITEMDYEG